MTNKKMVERDERTTFVENLSYKYGYNFIAFALLLNVMYRSLRFREAAWDLLGITIIGGFVTAAYQYRQKTLGKSWVKTIAVTFIVALIFGLVMALRLRAGR